MSFHGRNYHLDRQRKIRSAAKRRQRVKKTREHQQKVTALLRRLAEEDQAEE